MCIFESWFIGKNWVYSQEKKLSYSDLQGIWALDQNKGCPKKVLVMQYAFTHTSVMLKAFHLSKD